MAKKQSFADKASKRVFVINCPSCGNDVQFIKIVKPEAGENGSYKMRAINMGVIDCKNPDDPKCVCRTHDKVKPEKEVFSA